MITKYVAFDEVEFEDTKECEAYENALRKMDIFDAYKDAIGDIEEAYFINVREALSEYEIHLIEHAHMTIVLDGVLPRKTGVYMYNDVASRFESLEEVMKHFEK